MKAGKSSTVLYLSYDGLTDPLGQSQILPYLIKLSSDYEITIVSFEKPGRFKNGEREIRKIMEAKGMHWAPLKYHKYPPVISTLYDLYKLEKLAFQLHQRNHFSIVHCRSYLTSIVGLRFKRRTQAKFIFDMRGFWADERVEGGLWNLSNPIFRSIYNFFKKKERQFIQEADHTISLTENARSEIFSWGLTSKPIAVIPTCVDIDFFVNNNSEQGKNELLNKLGIKPATPILLYLGSWGTWYLTDEMIEYYQCLKREIPTLIFLIVSQDKIQIPAGIPDVIVTSAKREDVPNFIGIAWASIFFIKPSFSKKASSATKMGEMLAIGTPVITNTGWGDIDTFFGKFNGVVAKEDHATFKKATDWLMIKEVIKSNNEILGDLSLETGVKRYKAVYKALLHHE